MAFDDRTDKDPLQDLTIDVLGEILETKKGISNHRVFNYFSTQNINNFKKYDEKFLRSKLQIFLRRQIRQELFRISKQKNPQVENLKERFKDIFKSVNYCENISSKEYDNYIYRVDYKNDLRLEKPIIPYEKLFQIVVETFR
ncbi:MAG: hypothetical protein ACE5D6_09260, partial [Candidatus Zixiibacteriota bacterium]